MSEVKKVFVTGASSGIGMALAWKLVVEHDCYVYMGCRNVSKGKTVKESLEKEHPKCVGRLEVVEIEVGSDESVQSAAKLVEAKLSGDKLYAIVNNAGTGLSHGVDNQMMVNVNLNGPKRVTEAFLRLLNAESGRIVNLGSGAGPGFVKKCLEVDSEDYKLMTSGQPDWSLIDNFAKNFKESSEDGFVYYGLSKACLHKYTEALARDHPYLVVSSCSPGYIMTAMTKGHGATKTPEEGCFPIIICLFNELPGNGYYYGSDGLRSPLHFMRNPGEVEFTGYNQNLN